MTYLAQIAAQIEAARVELRAENARAALTEAGRRIRIIRARMDGQREFRKYPTYYVPRGFEMLARQEARIRGGRAALIKLLHEQAGTLSQPEREILRQQNAMTAYQARWSEE